MIFKLLQYEKEYLLNQILVDKKEVMEKIKISKLNENHYSICVDASLADEIRDLCSDKLQLFGFNENYELNKDGEILERLIDIFYID